MCFLMCLKPIMVVFIFCCITIKISMEYTFKQIVCVPYRYRYLYPGILIIVMSSPSPYALKKHFKGEK